MTRYANILALFPRSRYGVADNRDSPVVTGSVSSYLWLSIALYKLACFLEGLVEPVVSRLRTPQKRRSVALEPRSQAATRQRERLRTRRPPRILRLTRKQLAALGRWYRHRVKPSVRRWVDEYLAATKENEA